MDFVLEELSQHHIDKYYEILQNDLLCTLSGYDKPKNKEDMWQNKYVAGDRNSYSHKGCKYIHMVAVLNDEIIGDVGYHLNPINNEIVEFGLMVNIPYWRKGIGTNLTYWLLDYAFNNLGSPKISCCVELSNDASNALMKRVGMKLSKQEVEDDILYNIYTINKEEYTKKTI